MSFFALSRMLRYTWLYWYSHSSRDMFPDKTETDYAHILMLHINSTFKYYQNSSGIMYQHAEYGNHIKYSTYTEYAYIVPSLRCFRRGHE